MKNGKYKENSTNFNLYKASYFRPYLFYSGIFETIGCGPATLSLLTGEHPVAAAASLKDKHTSDEQLLKRLADFGIHNYPITKCEMTDSATTVVNKITSQHVVLISQLYIRNVASWGVLYDEILYHNFRPCAWTSMDLLNRPVLSAYVLWKPEWYFKLEY
jgi:hypothetical protein